MGESGAALRHAMVKICNRQSTLGRIAPDLVERQQHVIAVERRVLERLRHHRPGELLDLEREVSHACLAVSAAAGSDEVEGEYVAQELEDADVRAEPGGARL